MAEGLALLSVTAADPADAGASWQTTLEKRSQWWSFQPLRDSGIPENPPGDDTTHPVDRFLRVRLRKAGLEPAPETDRATLLRRLTYVLTGLPPSPEETAAFIADADPEAYDRTVDRLLDSPRFGERWARHWMDLVRYCESHGSQGDPELPMAWRYRDYLIRAFNADVPYGQLVREHIAGDLLPNPRINPSEGLNESAIGPAHLRMVEHGYVPVDALDDSVKVVDNQIDVVTKTFLGLTVSCARCHDHKFDPISQRDFFALYGIFASCRPGQVVVDAPGVRSRNLDELATLKERIGKGLDTAWHRSARTLPGTLLAQADRSARLARLDGAIRDTIEAITRIESRVRSDWAREQKRPTPSEMPAPLARWTFETDLQDSVGSMNGRAESGATIRNGRLVLQTPDAHVVTTPLPVELREKTLEAWVTLADLDQRGGGALTVQTPDSAVFDSIVFGEREPGHWIAGSDYFNRTDDAAGTRETARPDELIHLAIVYRSDHSITLYRNGQHYGRTYTRGTLTPFAAQSGRVVLGRRHLAPGVTALRGEIEEARLYSRALEPAEVLASYRAGVDTLPAAELLARLTPAERTRLEGLRRDLEDLRSRQTSLVAEIPKEDPWISALGRADREETSPLHAWVKLAPLEGQAFRQGWLDLSNRWSSELAARHAFNATNHMVAWDLTGPDAAHWFQSGTSTPPQAEPAGGFTVEPTGERVVRGLQPAGIQSNPLTRKQPTVVTSPRFRVETDSISLRVLGEHTSVRLVVENYAIGGGGLYPAQTVGQDEMGWVRLDTAYRKGSSAYLELVTAEDFPNPGLRSGGRAFQDGRAHFGISAVAFHAGSQPPRETHLPIAFLLRRPAPGSARDLAALYGRLLEQAVEHRSKGTLEPDEFAFLDAFVRLDLLPTSSARLPGLAQTVAEYRRLEAAIPVPRRAPGVHEAAGFDQPLHIRGQPDKPGPVVARRHLEVLGGRDYSTSARSGRLELAEDLADPSNPLVSRVMVNRLWHHVFGRGLVGSTDNFGALGEPPTHPELLDFLARRFLDRGGSIKDTLRLLVTSHAFCQSSAPSEAARRVDPANELLSHARVRRLEAEGVRDAILSVAGQLDLRMFGPGVNVYYVGKTEGGGPAGPLDGDRRRSVYQRIRRNAHNPLLEAFDAPKPASTRGRRDSTNVPAQALTLLNDPFVIEMAARWAAEVVASGHPQDVRIASMFARAMGRPITPVEAEAARGFIGELATEQGVSGPGIGTTPRVWQDFAQSLFCMKEFIYVD
ncbi:MAG: DUF1553 domain-containing protein [Verrucomicrobiota bacterium]